METTTKTRREELEERIARLQAQEQEQFEALVQKANVAAQEAQGFWDSHKAEAHRNNATRPAVLAQREARVQRLRAESELIALEIAEVDDVLPDARAKVERLQEQRKKLDAQIAEAKRPLHDLEGRRQRLQIEYYRLTHEADAFLEGSEAMR